MSWWRGGQGVGPRQRRVSTTRKRMREKLVLPSSGWLSQGKGLPRAGQMGVSGPSRAPGLSEEKGLREERSRAKSEERTEVASPLRFVCILGQVQGQER